MSKFNTKIIGITGPTGAGKTTALNLIAELGGQVIDCDAVYHDLLEHCAELSGALVERFGTAERTKLAAIVFADPAALRDLGGITHRFIIDEVERQIQAAQAEGRPAVGVDAIGLIGSNLYARCDETVAVLAPIETRIARVMAREGIAEEAARARALAQKPDEYFIEHCTHVLYNTGTQAEFAARARVLIEKIIAEN